MDTQTENIENIPVRGVTWKQLIIALISMISGLMTIEATLLGFYYKQDSKINTIAEKQLTNTNNIANMRVDVDLLKLHDAAIDAEFRSARYSKP